MKTTRIILGIYTTLVIAVAIISLAGSGSFSVALADLAIEPDTSINATVAYNNDTDYNTYVRYMTYPVALQNSGNTVWNSGTAAERRVHDDPVQKEIFTVMATISTTGGITENNFDFGNTTIARAAVVQRLGAISTMLWFNSPVQQYDYSYHVGPGNITDSNGYFTSGGNVASTGISSVHHLIGKAETFAPDWSNAVRLSPTRNDLILFYQTGASAYDGIQELAGVSGGYIYHTYGDCLGAIMTSIWNGTAQAMGSYGFNAKFSGTAPLDMYNFGSGGLLSASIVVTPADLPTNVVPGDRVYFQNYNYGNLTNTNSDTNPTDYTTARWIFFFNILPAPSPAGVTPSVHYANQGENSLYLGNVTGQGQLYSGLGMTYTADAMKQKLIYEYKSNLSLLIGNVALQPTYFGLDVTGNVTPDDILTIVTRLQIPQ